MVRHLRFLPPLLVFAFVVGGPLAYAQMRERHLRNFRVVEEGVLYRSAQLSPVGLERVIHDHGIRTVVTFRYADDGESGPPDQWEEAMCARLGVNHHRLRLGVWSSDANGVIPADAAVWEFLKIVRDPAKRPVLVHCFRGVHRTGSVCAIFRMECQGWPNADAMQEMKDAGYDRLDREEDVRRYMENYRPGRTK